MQSIAKKIEKTALRKEQRLLRSASQRQFVASVASNFEHPMGKLNVSSVLAPSDVASPRMSERKILDSRVFGSEKRTPFRD